MDLKEIITQVNLAISKNSWLDMEVLEMKGRNLTIIGSMDFTYYHTLEVVFEDVFFVSILSEWKTDTSISVISLVEGEECVQLNQKYNIEQGYSLFRIDPEDIENSFYIAAKNIHFNTNKVLYYKKDRLDDNERVADWVR